MENKWARKATERERAASVAIYHLFENYALLPTGDGKSDGWGLMLSDASKLAHKDPECTGTISGLVHDISNRETAHSNG
jgi:hypothetical protein